MEFLVHFLYFIYHFIQLIWWSKIWLSVFVCKKTKVPTSGNRHVRNMGGHNEEGAGPSPAQTPPLLELLTPLFTFMWCLHMGWCGLLSRSLAVEVIEKARRGLAVVLHLGDACRCVHVERYSSLDLPRCWGMTNAPSYAHTPAHTYRIHFTTWRTRASKCVSPLEYTETDHFHFLCRCPLGMLNPTVWRQRERQL